MTTRFLDMLLGGKGAAPVTALALAEAVAAAENERSALRAREQELSAARVQALLTGEDAELDALEAEIAGTLRSLDRQDLRIPELRKLHAERVEIEQRGADRLAFAAALEQRLAAARAIDAALESIGQAYDALEDTGRRLWTLQRYHGSERGAGAMPDARPSPVLLALATYHYARKFARLLEVTDHGRAGNRECPFADQEASFWQEVQAKAEARHAS